MSRLITIIFLGLVSFLMLFTKCMKSMTNVEVAGLILLVLCVFTAATLADEEEKRK